MMNQPPENGASASSDERRARIAEAMAGFEAARKEREAEIRRLRADEDPACGRYHAQAIFTAQQDKLRLDVELELCRKQLRRLDMGLDPDRPMGDAEPRDPFA